MTDRRDDAGAETQANFHYQHCCTGRWCVILLADAAGIVRIRCETHDDFTVEFESKVSEIVSVKYRDGSRGPWTVPRLVGEGVLEGLLRRWIRLGESVTCRLMTNAALDREAQKLRDCCLDGDPDVRRTWAEKLGADLSAEPAVVERLLRVLTLESRQVSRETVERVESVALRGPLRKMNVADPGDPRYFARIVDLVATANRAVDPVDMDAIDLSSGASATRQADARTIDRSKIVGALLSVLGDDDPPLAGTADPRAAGTMLVRKLEAGGMPPTSVVSAQLLRAAWTDHETRWQTDLPGSDAEWTDLRTRVVHLASRAERAVDRTGQYGPAMLGVLEATLTEDALGRSPAVKVSDLLLLGLVYQLTDECHIYWSPKNAVTD